MGNDITQNNKHIYNNQHFWAVIAQCHNPYREFAHCDRCNKYEENGNKMTKKQFSQLAKELSITTNPMYLVDSNDKLI